MIGSPSPRAFYLAAGYLVCLAVIGILLMVDKQKSARVDALQRRLSMERQLHEQEWQTQQRALEAAREREVRLQQSLAPKTKSGSGSNLGTAP